MARVIRNPTFRSETSVTSPRGPARLESNARVFAPLTFDTLSAPAYLTRVDATYCVQGINEVLLGNLLQKIDIQ